jgi:transposase
VGLIRGSSFWEKKMNDNEFPVVHSKSAGIDLASFTHFVAAYPGSCENRVQSFGCFTCDLRAMAQWLVSIGVTHAVMEATGSYWFQVALMLQSYGIVVDVVDPRSVRRLPGHKKSDVIDSIWLQKMYACGLLSSCFVPSAATMPLRTYHRRRGSLVEACSQQILMMQKEFTLMNIQIHQVLSGITGKSGMRIVRAIVGGERDGQVLAAMCSGRLKASKEDIVKSLEGTWAAENLFCLGQSLAIYDHLCRALADVDEQIARELAALCQSKQEPSPSKGARKNQPRFELAIYLKELLGCDVTKVEGFDVLTVLTVVSEMGLDLSRFPSKKHFASFHGLCANNKSTGGKVSSRRSAPVSSATAKALRLAAQSLCRSKSYLGAFLRSVAARRGMPKAITATARKLAELYYVLVTKGGEYTMRTVDDFEKVHADRRLERLTKACADLGYAIVALPKEPKMELVS